MQRARPWYGTVATSLGPAALGACTAFLLLVASPIDAGAGAPQKHAALSREVAVDGALIREGSTWFINLRASNSGAREQRCQVTASLTHMRASPMARTFSVPQIVWSSAVAMRLPPHGDADRKLQLPADVAGRIRVSEGNQNAPPAEIQETFGVRVKASCGEKNDLVS